MPPLKLDDINRFLLTSVAIYFSDDFLDVGKVNITPGGLKISYLQRFPILKNLKNATNEETSEELNRILDKAFDDIGGKPYKIAVNLKNDLLTLRRFPVTGVHPKELKRAIVFEAQKYTHLPVDDLAFGYACCSKKGNCQEIIFAATETKNIEKIVDYFAKHDILPTVIEPAPILISQILTRQNKLEKAKAYLSIHYEPSNKILITGIWHSEAHFFKEAAVFPMDEEFKTTELHYPTLKDAWPVIENEVLGSVDYLRKETKKNVERIFVSGFSFSESEEAGISKDLGIEVARPALRRFSQDGIENPDRSLPVISLLNNTVENPPINLAPKDIQSQDPWAFKPAVIKACIAICVIIAIHFVLAGFNISQAKNISKLKKSIAVYNMLSPDATRDEALKLKKMSEEKSAFIYDMAANRISLAEKMRGLAKNLTANSWLDTLSFFAPVDKARGKLLKIYGEVYLPSSGGGDVRTILDQIKKDPVMMQGFKEAELSTVKNKKIFDKDVAEFEIILK